MDVFNILLNAYLFIALNLFIFVTLCIISVLLIHLLPRQAFVLMWTTSNLLMSRFFDLVMKVEVLGKMVMAMYTMGLIAIPVGLNAEGYIAWILSGVLFAAKRIFRVVSSSLSYEESTTTTVNGVTSSKSKSFQGRTNHLTGKTTANATMSVNGKTILNVNVQSVERGNSNESEGESEVASETKELTEGLTDESTEGSTSEGLTSENESTENPTEGDNNKN